VRVGGALESVAETLADGIVEESEFRTTIPKLEAVIQECASLKYLFQDLSKKGEKENRESLLRESRPALGFLVRKGGLEPPRFYPPDPKSGASANSATFAGWKYSLLRFTTAGKIHRRQCVSSAICT
jgi:hypothetical protein